MLGLVVTDPLWQHRLQRFSPMSAGLAVQSTRSLNELAVGPWVGLGFLAVYGTAMLACGAAILAIKDA